MRKVVVSQFVSLDRVIEDPAGTEGSGLGAWSFQFDRGIEGDTFKLEEVMASDALLLGRKTYQVFADSWPSRSGDFADKFRRSSSSRQRWIMRVEQLDADQGPGQRGGVRAQGETRGDILVDGSAQLVQTPNARALSGA